MRRNIIMKNAPWQVLLAGGECDPMLSNRDPNRQEKAAGRSEDPAAMQLLSNSKGRIGIFPNYLNIPNIIAAFCLVCAIIEIVALICIDACTYDEYSAR